MDQRERNRVKLRSKEGNFTHTVHERTPETLAELYKALVLCIGRPRAVYRNGPRMVVGPTQKDQGTSSVSTARTAAFSHTHNTVLTSNTKRNPKRRVF